MVGGWGELTSWSEKHIQDCLSAHDVQPPFSFHLFLSSSATLQEGLSSATSNHQNCVLLMLPIVPLFAFRASLVTFWPKLKWHCIDAFFIRSPSFFYFFILLALLNAVFSRVLYWIQAKVLFDFIRLKTVGALKQVLKWRQVIKHVFREASMLSFTNPSTTVSVNSLRSNSNRWWWQLSPHGTWEVSGRPFP